MVAGTVAIREATSTKRQEIDIKTKDGVAHAWTYRGGEGPCSAVLLYPDAGGVRPAMHEMAERIAGLGYLVLLPDVFYRAGPGVSFNMGTVWDDPPERARLMELLSSINSERVGIDGGAYLEAIGAQPGVRKDRVGITGYCMGGRMAFLTAGKHPDKVRAAASFHGGGLVTDKADSPHLLADRIRASLYFGIADPDRGCTPEHQGALAAALGAAHVDYRIELFPGKKHGFAVSDHGEAYDPEAADRHWRRIESFFGDTLT